MNIGFFYPRHKTFRVTDPVPDMTVEQLRIEACALNAMSEGRDGFLLVGWVNPEQGDYMGVFLIGDFKTDPTPKMKKYLELIEGNISHINKQRMKKAS